MKKKENIIKDVIDDNDLDSGDYLNFIKINRKNKIEEVSNEEHIQQLIEFSNTLALENEDSIGQEINKFFNLILTENKEGEALKVNIAISNRIYKEENINKSLDIILNRKETSYIVLTGELCENISIILTSIYQKIKNNNKISTFNELLDKINNFNYSEEDILKKYLINKDEQKNKNEEIDDLDINYMKSSECIIKINGRKTMTYNNKKDVKKSIDCDRSTIVKNSKNTDNITNNNNKNEDKLYEYKELKNDNKYELPPEMLILRRKFQTIKKIKLIIDKNYHAKNKSNNDRLSSHSYISGENNNSNGSLNDSNDNANLEEFMIKKKDIDNNIFVLLNLNWLFPQLIEIDMDFSNEDLMKDQISVYKSGLISLANMLKRSLKKTNYHSDIVKEKINYDPLRGSIFPNYTKFNEEEEENSEEESNSSFSLEISELKEDDNNNKINENNNNNIITENNNKNNNEDNNKNLINNFDIFIKKYQYTLQMIIIYGYFTSKIPKLFFCNFTLPINLEREIIRMLQIHQIYFASFNILSFLSDVKMIKITYDFNSLDNKAFQEMLSLLYKNNNLHICQLNFFPSDNYFESELLFKLLQDSDSYFKSLFFNKNSREICNKIQAYEDLDIFMLKKLSEYFQTNIDKLFQIICIKSTVSELSLIFNYPLIINKIDYYLIIILKFIMNLFIVIDNSKLNLTSFILQANNFYLDSRKYPFLIEFLEKIYIFSNKELRLSKLILEMKFININNIYRIIPYNINELSIGDFDYESFVYFVEYITSAEFSVHSKLSKLKIILNSNLLFMENNLFEYLLSLFNDYPKKLKEISLHTQLSITLEQLNILLNSMNSNTIENIYMTFSKKSLNDKGYEQIKNEIFYLSKEKILNDENYIDLYCIKRTIKAVNIIKDNIMRNLSLKYNKKYMDYNIFKSLEKFLSKGCKKKYLIQFK